MNPNNLVCRTCLGIVSEEKSAHNIDDENGLIRNVRNIREMIMFCVPEMDSYVSINPVICDSCLGVLVTVYNFKIRCMRVENAIRLYVAANNLMEGSCVNLNNVVKQQIIEALKQKKWPNNLIKEYVDKHLSASPIPSEVFQAMSKTLNAAPSVSPSVRPMVPESPLNLNSSCLPGMNIGAPPQYLDINNVNPPFGSNIPPLNASMRVSPHANAAPTTKSNYISVSKNLMPPRPKPPTISQQLFDINRLNSPPLNTIHMASNMQPRALASLEPPRPMLLPPANLQTPSPNTTPSPNIRDFQNEFLSSLQLISTAPGGRQEAVLVRNKERKMRSTSKKKKSAPQVVPQSIASTANILNHESNHPLTRTLLLNPVIGAKSNNLEKRTMKETGLRKVRKPVGEGNKGGNKEKDRENDEIIILDDDDMTEAETLLINFDEDAVLVEPNEQDTPINTNGPPPEPAKTIDPRRRMVVRLPQLDKETLKRKLTPDDIIEEIESKRRKMVIKLNPCLPYLHKNKRLQVKVARDRIFACTFCKFASLRYRDLRKHYLSHHKVCSLCGFKAERSTHLTHHLNGVHYADLQEALKKVTENKSTFHCYICNFTGLSDTDLKDHRLRIHIKCGSEGMYKCPFETCTKKEEAIAYNILRHIEMVHDREKQTQCPLCNYRAPTVSVLRGHVRTHSLTRMKCHMCLVTYKSNMALQRHIQRNHPNVGTQSMTGMVYTAPTEADGPVHDDDYRVTLDNFRAPGTHPEPRQEPTTNSSRDENGTNDVAMNIFSLPSLSEMLCAQTFLEEASDQEGDCTIVSDDETSSVSTAPKRKSRKSVTEGDATDCLIINPEIPTVSVSDDEESTDSSKRKRTENYSGTSRTDSVDSRTDPDIIEIDDRNDNEDCFVVDSCVESSTQTTSVNVGDIATSKAADGSETDTCSESAIAAKEATQQSEVSAKEIETNSEPSTCENLAPKNLSEKDKAEANVEEGVTHDKEKAEASPQDPLASVGDEATKDKDISPPNSLESPDKEKDNAPSKDLTSENETEASNSSKDHDDTRPDISTAPASKNKTVKNKEGSEPEISTDKSKEQNEAQKNREGSESTDNASDENKTTSDDKSSTEETEKTIEDKISSEVEEENQSQGGKKALDENKTTSDDKSSTEETEKTIEDKISSEVEEENQSQGGKKALDENKTTSDDKSSTEETEKTIEDKISSEVEEEDQSQGGKKALDENKTTSDDKSSTEETEKTIEDKISSEVEEENQSQGGKKALDENKTTSDDKSSTEDTEKTIEDKISSEVEEENQSQGGKKALDENKTTSDDKSSTEDTEKTIEDKISSEVEEENQSQGGSEDKPVDIQKPMEDTISSEVEEVNQNQGESDKPTDIQKPMEDKISSKVEDSQNQGGSGDEPIKTSKESQKESDIVPDVEQTEESVLIESSDEDSNDCTFVSETGNFKNNSNETVEANEEVKETEPSEALQSEESAKESEKTESDLNIREKTSAVEEASNEASSITAKEKPLVVPEEKDSGKSKSDNEISENENNKMQNQDCSDPNTDSDDNVIISDSETQKSLDIELTTELTKGQLPIADDTDLLNSEPLMDSEMEDASKSSQQSSKELGSGETLTDLVGEMDKLLENSDNSSDKEISVLPTLNMDANLEAANLESTISNTQEIPSTAKLDLLEDIFEPIVTSNPVESMTTIDPLEDMDTLETVEESLISVLETTNSIFPESRMNFDSVLKEFDIGIKEGMDVTEDNSVNETSSEDLLKSPKPTSIESILKEDCEPSTSKTAVNTGVESEPTKDKDEPVEKNN